VSVGVTSVSPYPRGHLGFQRWRGCARIAVEGRYTTVSSSEVSDDVVVCPTPGSWPPPPG